MKFLSKKLLLNFVLFINFFSYSVLFADNHDVNEILNKIQNDIKTLDKAGVNDLTFFDSIKYKDLAASTKASYCITTLKLEKFISIKSKKIIVKTGLLKKKLQSFIDLIFTTKKINYLLLQERLLYQKII